MTSGIVMSVVGGNEEKERAKRVHVVEFNNSNRILAL